MKKENIYRVFYGISALLVLVFIIAIAIDHRMCYKCDPGYFFVLFYQKTLFILLPALLCFMLGLFLKHHYNRE